MLTSVDSDFGGPRSPRRNAWTSTIDKIRFCLPQLLFSGWDLATATSCVFFQRVAPTIAASLDLSALYFSERYEGIEGLPEGSLRASLWGLRANKRGVLGLAKGV